MHPHEEQLSDYVDGVLDAPGHEQVALHLEQCAECALFVAELQHIVAEAASLRPLAPPPAVWRRIEQGLPGSPLAAPRRWDWKPAWALATAAAIVLAFLAGRVIEQREHREQGHPQAVASSGPSTGARSDPDKVAVDAAANVRERVLLVAVGDHLERSQMVLVELTNAQTKGELDISVERQSADELLASNRLYRQTAVQLGQTNVASVLDDLERVLVEVARGPSQVSMQQLAEIQQRIEAQGILFKVKVIGSDMRERGNSTVTGRKQPVS